MKIKCFCYNCIPIPPTQFNEIPKGFEPSLNLNCWTRATFSNSSILIDQTNNYSRNLNVSLALHLDTFHKVLHFIDVCLWKLVYWLDIVEKLLFSSIIIRHGNFFSSFCEWNWGVIEFCNATSNLIKCDDEWAIHSFVVNCCLKINSILVF